MKSNEKIKAGEAAALAAKLSWRGFPAKITNALEGKTRKQIAASLINSLRSGQKKRPNT